jgi:NADPH:quinone reductase-like Zn-dependent oxidoreductase
MKAAVYSEYGPPDVVQIAEVETPVPKHDEVLIEVHAASLNPYDWHFVRGLPGLMRLISGLRRPKDMRLGADVAGRVRAVGAGVTRFKPGDAVFGICRGSVAELACARESALVEMPANVSFEQAAAAGIAALTALQALRDKGRLRAGQTVLVNGAAGGVGTFAVQIARANNAEVTGVCSARNVELVKSIGADHVVDYTREDFTKSGRRYDLILDCVGNHSLGALTRVLAARGTYVGVGGGGIRPEDFSGLGWTAAMLGRSIAQLVRNLIGRQKLTGLMAKGKTEDLETLRGLFASGEVTPVIDRRFALAEVRDALRYVEQGHARGKVVIGVRGTASTVTFGHAG